MKCVSFILMNGNEMARQRVMPRKKQIPTEIRTIIKGAMTQKKNAVPLRGTGGSTHTAARTAEQLSLEHLLPESPCVGPFLLGPRVQPGAAHPWKEWGAGVGRREQSRGLGYHSPGEGGPRLGEKSRRVHPATCRADQARGWTGAGRGPRAQRSQDTEPVGRRVEQSGPRFLAPLQQGRAQCSPLAGQHPSCRDPRPQSS